MAKPQLAAPARAAKSKPSPTAAPRAVKKAPAGLKAVKGVAPAAPAPAVASKASEAPRRSPTAPQKKSKSSPSSRPPPQRKQPQQKKAAPVWEEAEDDDEEADTNAVDAEPLTAEQLRQHDPIVRQTQQQVNRLLQQQPQPQKLQPAKRQAPRSTPSANANTSTTSSSNHPPAPAAAPSTASSAASTPSASVRRAKPTAKRQRAEVKVTAPPTTDEGDREEEADDDDDKADVSRQPRAKRPRTTQSRAQHRGNPADDTTPEELSERGVIYLGHLPHGFFEDQMRGFFTQFGEVTRLRLARNQKSGASKHYAFIEFAHSSVASVVADAMHRYLMFGHTLVASVVPPEKVHPELFKGADRPFRRIPHRDNARREHNRQRSVEQQEKRVTRLMNREKAKRQLLKEMDIPFSFPGYSADLNLTA